MKRLIAILFVGLFVFSIPLAAQADRAAIEGKVAALLGDRSVQQEGVYHYNAVFAYSDNTEYWWSGLVIFNLSDSANSLMVGCFDTEGNAVAAGTFELAGNAIRADLLNDFMTEGSVSGRVSAIAIFGTKGFVADRFNGNTEGGVGEIEKEAQYYD